MLFISKLINSPKHNLKLIMIRDPHKGENNYRSIQASIILDLMSKAKIKFKILLQMFNVTLLSFYILELIF